MIEFFYDINSPYSYLAATQVEALAKRTASPLRFRPFLLGGVFKQAGNDAPARIPNKARWMLGDLARWAAIYDVPFRFPSVFPLNSLHAQRALVALDRSVGEEAQRGLALALYRAYWVDDRDLSTREAVLEIAAARGLDVAPLSSAMDAPETKDALRAATDEAVQRGAFGAPSLFVGDALFWGNDRLPLLEAHLRALGGA